MKHLPREIFLLFASLVFNTGYAEAPPIENYDEISENIFWYDLYPGGGWSLYCGYRFENSLGVNELRKPTPMQAPGGFKIYSYGS